MLYLSATCWPVDDLPFVCFHTMVICILIEELTLYSSSHNMNYEVNTLAVDGWAVTFGTVRAC